MPLVADLADAARLAFDRAYGLGSVPWDDLDPSERLAWTEAAIAVWARLIFADHGLDVPPGG